MSLTTAFFCVITALAVGDFLSVKTRGMIPSLFVNAVLFLIGYWTIFPKDIIEQIGIVKPISFFALIFLVIHIGTMLSIRDLIKEYKTVIISLVSIVGICFGTLVIGALFFPTKTLIIATPPLAGGLVATLLMSQAAIAKHLDQLAVLAILVYVMQTFVGYPLTSLALKFECRTLLKKFRNKEMKMKEKEEVQEEGKKLIPAMPKAYQTTYIILFKMSILASLSVLLEYLSGGYVSKYIIGLVLGVLAAEFGFIERKPLELSGTFGFYMTALMIFVFGNLSKASPAMVMHLFSSFVGTILLGVFGLLIFAVISAKVLKQSIFMSCAIGLNALYGFPSNYIMSLEAANTSGENEEEVEFLKSEIVPKMLIGGFVSVTIVSVVIAGVFVKFL